MMSLRHVLRRLARAPMFTAIAALTLAVGIGATGAIFSVINGILLKPLPYPHPDELVELSHAAPGVNLPDAGSAPFLHFTYREQGRSFQDVGLLRWNTRTITGLAEPETAQCLNVTAQVLPILGVQPALGRWFSESDDAPASPQTAVLMNGWWQARFGGDPSAIGRRIMVDGFPREVIGVMPATFRLLDHDAAFLLPLQFDRNKTILGQVDYRGIARLKPGVTIEQASADVARMIPVALHQFPPPPGLTLKEFEDVRFGPKLQYLGQTLVGDIAKTLWVVMGTIGIVLLIACANVANLLLVRAEGRQQELAIRAALGAGWRDVARELLMEGVALGLLGGALGLGLAYGAVRVLIAMAPAHLPRLDEISIDPQVILFTLATALVTGVSFGMIPVIKYARPRIADALRGGGRSASQSRERHRARNTLVVVQLALALVLLVGSGLMIRTFQALRRVDPGFDPRDVLTLRIAIPESQVSDGTAVIQLEQAILEKMRTIPGVTSAALTTVIPTEPGGGSDLVYARDRSYPSAPPLRRLKFVSPGLLATMGNRLIAGRELTWTDTYERRPVAMVSENLARELWQDPQRAIGKQIREDLSGPWREVIGVVGDEREDGVQEKAPTVAYYPLLMNGFQNKPVSVRRTVFYIVRSKRAGSQGLLADVQQAVWSLNSSLPLANVRTLQVVYDKSLARISFTLVLLAIAGAMALLIGLVGIYGMISYSVSQRRREIGIRIALGARQSELTRIFIADGFVLALIGVACGLAGAVALTRVLGSLLFDVSPLDPLTYAAVTLGLIAAAIMASYIPALRATGLDPVEALRAE
jgi:putative ABC transport system permease protein